jgi:DHA2 family multidrug resistance protein
MIAMIAVGRLVHRVDLRLIMATGFSLTAIALWQMTHITLDMDSQLVIVSGFIQGLGIGFTFVPLSAATFATLAPRLRNEGTPIFSLVRNIGGSVGISIVQTLLTRGTAQAHEQLAGFVARGNLALQTLPPSLSPDTPTGLALLNAEVTRQAAMVAYVNDFRIMMAITVMAIPLLLLIRRSRPSAAASGDVPH